MTFESIFDIFRTMRDTLESAGTSAGLSGLFLAGLLALWYSKDRVSRRIRFLFVYATVMLIMVITPFYSDFCSLYLPGLTVLGAHQWFLPVTLVFMGTVYLISDSIKESRNIMKLGAAFLVIMFLAGATAYTERSFIPASAEGVYTEGKAYIAMEMVERYIEDKGEDSMLLLSSDDVMETVRRHDTSVCVLYGRDIFEGNKSMVHGVIYSEEQKAAYRAMHEGSYDIESITAIADSCGVTLIVLEKEDEEESRQETEEAGEEEPEELDLSGYAVYSENESYICYAREEKCNG